MNPVVVTMRGPSDIDVGSLSNFEAGVAFLTLLNQLNPGITFGQLARMLDSPEVMAGWWTSLKKSVGDVKDGVGDVLKDTASWIGGSTGSAVRLVTDEKVIDGASRIGTAYATSGGSEGVKQMLGGGDFAEQFIGFISNLGSSFKSAAPVANQAGMFNAQSLPWILGGGAVLVLVFGGRGRR